MSKPAVIIDNILYHFADIAAKREVQSVIATLDGDYRVTLKPGRPGVTDPQRAYWWAVVVKFFADFMRSHDPTLTLKEASDSAHVEIKRHCLPEPVTDGDGRLIAEKVGSLTKIDKARMSVLIDDAINWLGSEWQIAVPPPSHEERYGLPDGPIPSRSPCPSKGGRRVSQPAVEESATVGR